MKAHLKNLYGYNGFREFQKEVITDIMSGENVMVVLPTSGGKSLCYQFPATYLDKISIVISPLISLMADQQMHLESKGIKSICLNSETNNRDVDIYSSNVVYSTPEFFVSNIHLFERIVDKICLFAIDEAHCLSEWGHDFRKSYTELSIIKKTFPSIPIMTLTATATPIVMDDIYNTLQLTSANEYNNGVHRDNLHIKITTKGNDIYTDLMPYVSDNTQSTIIYTQTRKMADRIQNILISHDIACEKYHGAMSAEEKQRAHHNFIMDKTRLIVATICFGMGIDKPDIRCVINYDAPLNIETYYQEVGRAGRDNKPSNVVLFYGDNDFRTASFLISKSEQQDVKQKGLNIFLQYIYNRTICRQLLIGYYFKHGHLNGNITNDGKCNNCDNCETTSDDMVDITENAKIVVELVNTLHSSLGITKIVKILRGAKSFENYPLFGRGSNIGTDTWKEIINVLISMNILTRHNFNNYPVITFGKSKMTTPIRAILTHKPKEEDNSSMRKLQAIRAKLAREKSIAPYMVATDMVLSIIEKANPKSVTDLLELDGISYKFICDYGMYFLDSKEESKKSKSPTKNKSPQSSTFTDSFELYKQGHTLDEISKQRGLKRMTIENHIVKMLTEYPKYIDKNRIGLSPDMENEINDAIEKVGTARLKPIKDIVGEHISYFHIRVAMI